MSTDNSCNTEKTESKFHVTLVEVIAAVVLVLTIVGTIFGIKNKK